MFDVNRALNGLRNLSKDFLSISTDWETPKLSELSDPPESIVEREASYTPPIEPANLEEAFSHYKINAKFMDYRICPSVTVYEVKLPEGTRLQQVLRIERDLARDLMVSSLRIIELKDSANIGIEIANKERYPVYFKDGIKNLPKDCALPMILGEDIYGNYVFQDLAKMPHLLVAGQTGSGKSVFLNTFISTLLMAKKPEELELYIVDPKKVEFVQYENVPHVKGIAVNTTDAREMLTELVEEMDTRYEAFREKRVKKLSEYNAKTKHKLPMKVMLVDEFSDLMLSGGPKQKEAIQDKIVRIAQMGRAAGIHLVLATQKPTSETMTSRIKANMPARIAFSVTSWRESQVILDMSGAEALIGQGDMLFLDPTAIGRDGKIRRIQAPMISDEDLEYITEGK
jgi:S-DNA-T family DNA segregation ATPase FtsK/SpoIIIE